MSTIMVGATTDRPSVVTLSPSVGVAVASGSGARDHAETVIHRPRHRAREMFVKVEVMLHHQLLQLDAALGLCEWTPIPGAGGRGKFVYGDHDEGTPTSAAFSAAKEEMTALQAQARKSRHAYEALIRRQVRALPVWSSWAEQIRGAGDLGLGQILAEAGDLGGYANPAKLWKRFGLAVLDGERQRRCVGERGEEMGFSPKRRKLMYLIADSLMKANRGGEYKDYYDSEKERRLARGDEITKAHAHEHALRLLAKRYLRDLWCAWRPTEDGTTDHSCADTRDQDVRVQPPASEAA